MSGAISSFRPYCEMVYKRPLSDIYLPVPLQINFKVSSLNASPTVHGVLGQTYRETAKTYQKLVNGPEYKKLRANGMPFFVDGEEDDYQTSGNLQSPAKT
jgi:hypothetical protein